MQTIRHNGADVLYNVQKLAKKPDQEGFVFRVTLGGGGAGGRVIDVPLPDYAWAPGTPDGVPDPEQDKKLNAHRAGLPAKALASALETAFPSLGPARAAFVGTVASAPPIDEKKMAESKPEPDKAKR